MSSSKINWSQFIFKLFYCSANGGALNYAMHVVEMTVLHIMSYKNVHAQMYVRFVDIRTLTGKTGRPRQFH